MRLEIAFSVAAMFWLPISAVGEDPAEAAPEGENVVLYRQLLAALPMDRERSTSARVALGYWNIRPDRYAERAFVEAMDRKNVEVVLLRSPSVTSPGVDFTMALILVGGRVTDWASCCTHCRQATQTLVLEDVDGDGFKDVAFQATKGYGGLTDKRQHTRPGANGTWLYAYAISEGKLKSLFPATERDVEVVISYDTGKASVTLASKGCPKVLRERQMADCEITLTNISTATLAVRRGEWFEMESRQVNRWTVIEEPDLVELKPGESISQVVQFVVGVVPEKIEIEWRFVPLKLEKDAP